MGMKAPSLFCCIAPYKGVASDSALKGGAGEGNAKVGR